MQPGLDDTYAYKVGRGQSSCLLLLLLLYPNMPNTGEAQPESLHSRESIGNHLETAVCWSKLIKTQVTAHLRLRYVYSR